jgi:hypothetical protein
MPEGDAMQSVPHNLLHPAADAVIHPLLEEIKKLNLDAMTPLEALNHLHTLKGKLLAFSATLTRSKNSS